MSVLRAKSISLMPAQASPLSWCRVRPATWSTDCCANAPRDKERLFLLILDQEAVHRALRPIGANNSVFILAHRMQYHFCRMLIRTRLVHFLGEANFVGVAP